MEPTTRAVCLDILIDTLQDIVAIQPENLQAIRDMVKEWRKEFVYCTSVTVIAMYIIVCA